MGTSTTTQLDSSEINLALQARDRIAQVGAGSATPSNGFRFFAAFDGTNRAARKQSCCFAVAYYQNNSCIRTTDVRKGPFLAKTGGQLAHNVPGRNVA